MSINILNHFISPKELEATVWRYISLEKLESILKSNALYFATAEQFSSNDIFEGAITEKEYLFRKNEIEKFEKDPVKVDQELADIESAFKPLRKFAKISCWHFNSIENMAMWFNYQSNQKGIAIQSTPSKLLNTLGPYSIQPGFQPETINVAKVKYIDYETDDMELKYGFLTPFLYKRKNYAYEKEIRFIISLRLASEFGVDIPVAGINVPFDYNKGIEKLILSPYADKPYRTGLVSILEKYNPSFQIEESALLKIPKY